MRFTLLIAALCVFSASQASAQYSDSNEKLRLNIQGYLGFAGGASTFLDGNEVGNADLATSFGLQVQGLIPIGDYVLVGPALSFRSSKGENADSRVSIFGFDAAVGGHYNIDLGNNLSIDPYMLFTLGLAIVTDEDAVLTDDLEFGLGLGFRVGANLWFAESYGVNLGFGYQSAHIYPDTILDDHAHVRVQELAMEFGFAIRFGR